MDFVLPKSDFYLMAMLMLFKHDRGSYNIMENIRSGVLNVSRSIIQICFFGIAKEKSEKVMSSFATASSITVYHGSMMCCQDPRHGCW